MAEVATTQAAPRGPGPKRSWFNVGVMALAHFMSDYYTAFLPVLLPLLSVRYDISYTQSAAIYMVFSVAMNFIQPPIGIMADRRNLNFLMPLSVLTGGIFASAVILSPNLFTLLGIVLLCGICSSGFHPVSAGILTTVLPPRSKGFGTSIYIAGGNLGFALAPIIVAAVIERWGENSLLAMALPAVITTALIYLRHLQAPSPRPSKSTSSEGAIPEVKLSELICTKQFIVLNSSIALRSWSYCSLVTFIPLLFAAKGFSAMEGATSLVILLIGAVVGGLVGGALTDKFGPKKVTLGSFIVALLTGLIFLRYADLSLISLGALFLCGAGVYGSTPNAIVWAQRLMPGHAAFAASMMLGFTFGAGYIESVLTGYLGDLIGLQAALFYTVAVTMTLALILLALLKEPPKTDLSAHLAQAQEQLAANQAPTGAEPSTAPTAEPTTKPTAAHSAPASPPAPK